MRDAVLDLVLGAGCEACGRPGRALCPVCRAGLVCAAEVRWPDPCPPGLAPPWSAGVYDGALRAMVLAHKESGRLALHRPLGELLAGAVEAASSHLSAGDGGPLGVVPVPSHPAVVRQRGHDPLGRIARRAVVRLRSRGVPARLWPVLSVTGRPADQAGLDAGSRAANLAGAFRARDVANRSGGQLIVVDDVLTTGSTAREAQRALEEGGVRVAAVAVVAATARRVAPGVSRGE